MQGAIEGGWLSWIVAGQGLGELKLYSNSVNEQGQKRFLAIEDGVRESTQSWRKVLLKLRSRGMNVPELAIGVLGRAGGSVS